MCHHLLKKNGLSGKVGIIQTPVTRVRVAGEADGEEVDFGLQGPCAVRVRERGSVLVVDPCLIDEGFLGSGALPLIRYCRRALLVEDNPTVVPARVEVSARTTQCDPPSRTQPAIESQIYAMLVEFSTPVASGFNLSDLDKYRWSPW